MPWQEVGDRVFTRRFDFLDQQIGVVLGGDDVLVVDSRSNEAQAREVASEIRELTRNPISVVVNTHWHWDHAWGNRALRPATMWGHVRTAERLRDDWSGLVGWLADAYPDSANDYRSVVLDPPERTFAERATVELGDRVVELSHHGRGHTDSDIVALVPDAKVLFAGDLLEADASPSFGQSYPLDWPAAIERLLALATGAVVPGHGSVGGRAFVEAQLAAQREIVALARRIHAGDLDLEAAIAAAPFSAAAAGDAFERGLAQLRGELD